MFYLCEIKELPTLKESLLEQIHCVPALHNDDLANAKIYTRLQHKEVTAWLGVRNSAAHSKFAEYDANQVNNILSGIRGFINRYPA